MEKPGPVFCGCGGPKLPTAGEARRAFGPLRWIVLITAAVYFVTCGLWDPPRELFRVFVGMVVGAAAVYGDVRSGGRGQVYQRIALVFFVVGSVANVVVAGRSDW